MIAIFDIQLNFKENYLRQTYHSNHILIFVYSNIIANFIQSEISKDYIKEIDNFFINYFYLFINLIKSFNNK